jgi:hypothetical protein
METNDKNGAGLTLIAGTTPADRAREVLTAELASIIGEEKAEAIASAATATSTEEESFRTVADSDLYGLADKDLPTPLDPDYARAVLDKAMENAWGYGVAGMLAGIAFDGNSTADAAGIAKMLGYIVGRRKPVETREEMVAAMIEHNPHMPREEVERIAHAEWDHVESL